MRKLPPSGYKTAALSERPGYLARRMQEYRKRIDEEQAQRMRDEIEARTKVSTLPSRKAK